MFYQSVRKYPEAIEEIQKSLQQCKSHDYFIELARIYIELQNFTEALKYLNEALILDSQSSIALNLKSQCEQSQEHFLTNYTSSKNIENKIMQ